MSSRSNSRTADGMTNPGELVALPDGELLAVIELGDFHSSGLSAARISREHHLFWRRPLIGRMRKPGWAYLRGTAVLANRQRLFAMSRDGEVTLRVLPL